MTTRRIVSPCLEPSKTILSSKFSGFSVGSEMLVANQYSFGEVHGVEVDQFLVSTAQRRLSYFQNMFPAYYDGDILPFPDNHFEVVASGHIIEHTRSPKLYLHECIRVLKSGGYLNLEFPHRYHIRELHTLLPSFEWLPRPLRNRVILLLSSRFSPLKDETKSRYRSIVDTNLQQISLGGVKQILRKLDHPAVVIQSTEMTPGIIRCVIQKGHV